MKCKNIDKLKIEMENANYEKESQIGKDIFRKDGVVCSIFDTGTVLIQGVNNETEIKRIHHNVNYINNG